MTLFRHTTVQRHQLSLLILMSISLCSAAVIKNRTDAPSGELSISDGVTKLRLLASQSAENDWTPLAVGPSNIANETSLSEKTSVVSVDSLNDKINESTDSGVERTINIEKNVSSTGVSTNVPKISQIDINESIHKDVFDVDEILNPIAETSKRTTLEETQQIVKENVIASKVRTDNDEIKDQYSLSKTISESEKNVSSQGSLQNELLQNTTNLINSPLETTTTKILISSKIPLDNAIDQNLENITNNIHETSTVDIPSTTQQTLNINASQSLLTTVSPYIPSADVHEKTNNLLELEPTKNSLLEQAVSENSSFYSIIDDNQTMSSSSTNLTVEVLTSGPEIPTPTQMTNNTDVAKQLTDWATVMDHSAVADDVEPIPNTVSDNSQENQILTSDSTEVTPSIRPVTEMNNVSEIIQSSSTSTISEATSIETKSMESKASREIVPDNPLELPSKEKQALTEISEEFKLSPVLSKSNSTHSVSLIEKAIETNNTSHIDGINVVQSANHEMMVSEHEDANESTTIEAVTIGTFTSESVNIESSTKYFEAETLSPRNEENVDNLTTTIIPVTSDEPTKTTTLLPETSSENAIQLDDNIQTTQIVEEATTTDSFDRFTKPFVVDVPIIPTQTIFGHINKIEDDSSVTDKKSLLPTYSFTSTNQPDAFPVEEMPMGDEEDTDVNAIIAIVVSCVGVVCLILIIGFFIVMRKRQKLLTYTQRCRPVGLDAYSLDNVSVFNSVRRKGHGRQSKRAYGNAAFEDPDLKKHPLTTAALASFVTARPEIYAEFKDLPIISARIEDVPDGCEDKNRYANVVPLPETRCFLQRIGNDPTTEYINANFARGPRDNANYYIATQAPMEKTCGDFWRMIWEQNSRVIIMATDLNENGIERCAEYLPPSVVLDNTLLFGDFQVTLKAREVKNKYAVSSLHLRNGATNTWREITHFWYQWPDDKNAAPVPDKASVLSMLLESRTYLKYALADQVDEIDSSNGGDLKVEELDRSKSLPRHQGPLTVHCSPGTGRTGTLIACDIALRELELPHPSIDVPRIVYFVRTGRANAVATREQYEFIYEVAHLYATKLAGPHQEN